jgi:hypothetical protein
VWSRTIGAVFVAAGLLWVGAASATTAYGALLIDDSVKVGPDRYRVPKDKDWDKVMRAYRSAYGKTTGIIFRNIATTPEVKALHIENTSPNRTWEGINIYETNGEIFLYVIKAESGSKGRSKEKRAGT